MVRKSFMFIVGETSGDILAAELVRVLSRMLTDREAASTSDAQPLHASLEPEFFGAGGPHMARAGVKVDLDMTQHAVVGLWEVIPKYREFRGFFRTLKNMAIRLQPDVIICVDFAGFNLRFAAAIRKHVQSLRGTFGNWNPLLVQYVSPQVWASRPQRAQSLARNVDLVLSILPFEKECYAQRVPNLCVEFIGHPLLDRYGSVTWSARPASELQLLLLPGSRLEELRRHLPVMLQALNQVRSKKPQVRTLMVLPNEALTQFAHRFSLPKGLAVRTGGLDQALAETDVALASTGTVTLECAYFGVPTVALYKTSWSTYFVGKQLIQVKYLAMPNILANECVFPEFIQDAANPENLAHALLDLLEHPERRRGIQVKLAAIVQSLGEPGASERAADAILNLLFGEPKPIRAALAK
jgi:lipid-A-disaccharide synthase